MRTTITTILTLLWVGAPSVCGQVDNCLELVRLSRTESRTTMNQEQFSNTIESFCDEYRSARSQNRSLNLDLRVLGVGSGSGSEATANSLFTKYCSKNMDQRRSASNFQQYLTGISPDANTMYQACKLASTEAVRFQMLTPATRDLLELVVFHKTNVPGSQAVMSWSASTPVTCHWEAYDAGGGVEGTKQRILQANERTRLRCARDSFKTKPIHEPDFVNVMRDGGNAMINIPWKKYVPDNNPVLTLQEIEGRLENQVSALEGRLGALTVNFGSPVEMEFDQVHRAASAGLVTATVIATGGAMRRDLVAWIIPKNVLSLVFQRWG